MKWLLVGCLMLAPLAAAGDASDPEVTDALGDHFGGVSQDPTTAWDIEMIYFSAEGCSEGEDWVWLGVDNILENNQGNPGALFTGTVFFQVDGSPFRVVGRGTVNQGGADPTFTLLGSNVSETLTGAYHNDNAAPEGIHWCLPHGLVGTKGAVVDGIWGQTMVEELDGADRHELDRAPNDAPTTTGRPWILGGIPDAFPLLQVVVGDAEQSLVDGATSFFITIQNNGTADDTVSFNITTDASAEWTAVVDPANVDVAASGGAFVHVNVTFAGNLTFYEPATFLVNWQGSTMNGTITLHVPGVEAHSTPPPAETSDGNTTSDGTSDKESPVPFWVAAPVAWLAMRRRQRA